MIINCNSLPKMTRARFQFQYLCLLNGYSASQASFLRNFSQLRAQTRSLSFKHGSLSLLPSIQCPQSYHQTQKIHRHYDWLFSRQLSNYEYLSNNPATTFSSINKDPLEQRRRQLSTSPKNNNYGKGNYNNEKNQNGDGGWTKKKVRSALTGGIILSASLFSWKSKQDEDAGTKTTGRISVEKFTSEDDASLKSKQVNPNLPIFYMSEVSTHYNPSTRIWVSFNRGVYDVTEFVGKHPGGDRILLGAGGSLEPFWELYPVHQKPDVQEVLEKYRIGNLAEEDVISHEKDQKTDHFKGEPYRHPSLIVRSQKPFNGETPPGILVEKFFTPNDLFYVRNHLPVPEIDVKSYTFEVEGINIPKPKTFTLADIKKLPKVELSATIQCGGNRRSEMGTTKPVAGLAWSGGAIGNAKWTGARLRDVLTIAGFKPENYKNPEKIHVQFEGMDSDPSGECYGASVPLTYILDGNFDPVLAYEMNSKVLPLDHGFPIRIILPGIVGARSVKWLSSTLSRIVISEKENQSPWQQRDYKVFTPSITMETVNFADAPAIMDTPPTSYICSHENGQVIKRGVETLKGYAFSGGGRNIVRVELSLDKGKSWTTATLVHSNKASFEKSESRNWSWVIWELPLDFTKLKGEQEIWVKTVDSGYNQQTEQFQNIWNYRGLLANAYHKINLVVK